MIRFGDALTELKKMEDESVHCCVTSPPYWGLRDYGIADQIGLESTPNEYVKKLVDVFSEVKRVLRKDGTLWLNLGDSYATAAGGVGSSPGGGKQGENWKLRGKMTPPNRLPIAGLKPKDLVGIPWRVAFALQENGWFLRQDIIWHKPNPMPESVKDRCTKAHEYIFLLSKSRNYYFDSEAIKEPAQFGRPDSPDKIKSPYGQGFSRRAKGGGHKLSENEVMPGKDLQHLDKAGEKVWETRNKRSVWTVSTKPFKEAHFATFPQDLIRPCILAGSPKDGVILDPFSGSGTTGVVALEQNRSYVGIELNPEYIEISKRRFRNLQPALV